jgi:uncharacterized membrane protein YphA (DoxX/SURF4 family)
MSPPPKTPCVVVGIKPWLPWPFSRSRWWNEPVRAERLASLRIALASVLLLDLLLTYLPTLHIFYGADSLGHPARPAGMDYPAQEGLFDWYLKPPRWHWTLLKGVGDPLTLRRAMVVWVVATIFLLAGFLTRLSAVVVWVLSTSFANLNAYNDNAGDQIRGIALFYLMLCPGGAAWSLDALLARWWGRRGGWLGRWLGRPPGPVFVYPWALRLLVIQMAFVYCANGLYKSFGKDWGSGDSLYYVLNDLILARWSYTQVTVPIVVTRVLTWSVLLWEIGFPVFMMLPWLAAGLCRLCRASPDLTRGAVLTLRWFRTVALFFGVGFHLGIFLTMEIGWFGPYMICLYAPFVPWERWKWRRRRHPDREGNYVNETGPVISDQ